MSEDSMRKLSAALRAKLLDHRWGATSPTLPPPKTPEESSKTPSDDEPSTTPSAIPRPLP